MNLPLVQISEPDFTSFLRIPTVTDLATLEADFAIVGVPFGVPYDMKGVASGASEAPMAIRECSARYGRFLNHYDFINVLKYQLILQSIFNNSTPNLYLILVSLKSLHSIFSEPEMTVA